MSETCAVCKKGIGPAKCEICGFSDDGSINRSFPVPEDLNNWLETVVKPYRTLWEAKKRENELLAQLEEAKKREAELLARLSDIQKFADPRDGKIYRTVKIGNQVWMAENLNFDCSESKCYDNDTKDAKKYGRLYDWETAKKACPPGWHLPSNEEWQTLIDFVGGNEIAGKKLKAKNSWNGGWLYDEGKSDNSTDDYSFSAMPGGYGLPNGHFSEFGYTGCWWSTSEDGKDHAYKYFMICGVEFVYRVNIGTSKSYLYSVRCLRD